MLVEGIIKRFDRAHFGNGDGKEKNLITADDPDVEHLSFHHCIDRPLTVAGQ